MFFDETKGLDLIFALNFVDASPQHKVVFPYWWHDVVAEIALRRALPMPIELVMAGPGMKE